jgi:ABC-type Fe3+-hydroxamate transport system substrate-binding protein
MSLFAGRVWASHACGDSVMPGLSLKGRVSLFRKLVWLGVLALLPSGLRAAPQAAQVRLVDDAGREVVLPTRPTRIVSLVPVATEIIFELGEGRRVVGRSRFDDYPAEVVAVPDVGDAIRPSVEAVLMRDPDLVILVGGSDNAQAARDFEQVGVPFVVLLFNTLDQLQVNMYRLGYLVGRDEEAAGMWQGVLLDLEAVAESVRGRHRPSVYYDLGYPPAFTVGAGSYLDSLISLAGGRNVFHELAPPSPRVSLEAILARDPDVLVEPTIGTDGVEALDPGSRPGWENLRAVREGSIATVPSDLLHRLGPRIGEAARALALALHPELGEPE